MIEEAAGTSLYESKKEASCKLIEKKDAKVRETDTLLKEEVEPKLEKLRKEKSAYLEYQKICRDIEYLTRIHISYKYLKQKEQLKSIEKKIDDLKLHVVNSNDKIKNNEKEIDNLEKKCENIKNLIDNDSGGELQKLEDDLLKKQKENSAKLGKMKGLKESIEQEKRKVNTLLKSMKDDDNQLLKKQEQMLKIKDKFEQLKLNAETDTKLYIESQKRYEAITQGLSTNDDGEAATLQDQLMSKLIKILIFCFFLICI